MALTRFLVLACFVAVTVAENQQDIARSYPCDDVDQSKCTVGTVRIDPCKTKKKNACVFLKGRNVTIDFDFTPNFSTTNLKTGVYYQGMAFQDLSSDACELTPCPLVAGTTQVFNYTLYIGKKMPTGPFLITWKVWNGDNQDEVCCFKTNINLKKQKE